MDKIDAILGNMASNFSRETTQMVQKVAQSAQNYFHPLYQIESSYAQCDNLATPLTMHFLVTLFYICFGGGGGEAAWVLMHPLPTPSQNTTTPLVSMHS